MAVTASRVTVATTATVVATADADGGALLVKNVGAATVYLGPADVTTATGFPLGAGEAWGEGNFAPGEKLYGIVATGTVEVALLGNRA
jgi:hypothetical protein